MSDLTQIILLIIGIARFLIFAHIIVSLLVSFQILNPQQPFVRSIWEGLDRLFDPIYTPIRNMLPNTRPLDLSPIVALIGLEIIRILIT